MKKLVLFVALCATTGVVLAQGFYGKVGVGYNFNAAAAYGVEISGTTDSETYTTKPFSLGKGVNTALGFGYMFNKYIGAELGINYMIGVSTSFKDEFSDLGSSSEETTEYSSSGLSVTPSIKLVVPATEKLSVYSRFGLALPIVGKATVKEDYTSSTGNSSSQTTEITSYFKIGYAGAIGVSYSLTDNLEIFGEFNGLMSSFAAKKSEITESTENGVDQLPGMTTRDKETEYKKEITYDYNSQSDPNSPRQSSSYTLPSSNFGLMVGVSLKF